MITRILPGQSDSALQEAAELLRCGATVAFPTDTVYGLGAHALNAEAVHKIYEAKGRPSDKPLIILICDKTQLDMLAADVPEQAQKLMDAFWPGPLTLVFQKKADVVPDYVTRGFETVAVRMPNHPVALNLLKKAEVPVAAPSANLSGNPSAVNAEQVIKDLDGRIAAVVDGGSCQVGIASTILDMSGTVPVILRQGSVTKAQLEAVLGQPVEDGFGSAGKQVEA